MKGKTSKKKEHKLFRWKQKAIIKACLDFNIVQNGSYPKLSLPSRLPLRGRYSLTEPESACEVYYTYLKEDIQNGICTDPIQTLTRGEGIDAFLDKIFKPAKEYIPSKFLHDFLKKMLQLASKEACGNKTESVHSKQQYDEADLRHFLEKIKASNHKNGLNLNTSTSKFFEHKQANKPFESEGISLSATRGLPGDSHLLTLK